MLADKVKIKGKLTEGRQDIVADKVEKKVNWQKARYAGRQGIKNVNWQKAGKICWQISTGRKAGHNEFIYI